MKQSTMKSITIIIPRLDEKAPIQVAMALAKQLSKKYQVCVYTLRGKGVLYSDGLRIKTLTVRDIGDILKSDIIHTHCFLPDLFGLSIKLLPCKSPKLVCTVHCDPLAEFQERKYRKFLIKLWFFALKRYDKAICLNSYVNDILNSRGVSSCIIYNGKDVEFKELSELNSKIIKFAAGRKIIGTYSVLRPIKGLEQLINYAKNMEKSKCIVIAGDGELMANFKSKLFEYSLENKVLLLGFVKNAHNLLPFFDVFVMTSRSEGFPIALIEALASGVPICHSNIPQLVEFKNKLKYTAEVYELDKISSLSEGINSCITSSLSTQNGAHNKSVYIEFLTESSMCCSYIKYCYEIN